MIQSVSASNYHLAHVVRSSIQDLGLTILPGQLFIRIPRVSGTRISTDGHHAASERAFASGPANGSGKV